MVELAREAMDNFVKAQKHFMDVIAEETAKATGSKQPKTRYPRVVAAKGKAPVQYPDADEDDADAPQVGLNLRSGEAVKLGKR